MAVFTMNAAMMGVISFFASMWLIERRGVMVLEIGRRVINPWVVVFAGKNSNTFAWDDVSRQRRLQPRNHRHCLF